jgi:hypothetical protein
MTEKYLKLLTGRFLISSGILLCAGVAIAWMDTRPGWDDTAITACAIAIVAALGSAMRVPPWLAAALVGGPILAAEISGGPGVLLAVAFAAGGAYIGAFIRRLVREA